MREPILRISACSSIELRDHGWTGHVTQPKPQTNEHASLVTARRSKSRMLPLVVLSGTESEG